MRRKDRGEEYRCRAGQDVRTRALALVYLGLGFVELAGVGEGGRLSEEFHVEGIAPGKVYRQGHSNSSV